MFFSLTINLSFELFRRTRNDDDLCSVVLRVGYEGGSISLLKRFHERREQFRVDRGETPLLDEEEMKGIQTPQFT